MRPLAFKRGRSRRALVLASIGAAVILTLLLAPRMIPAVAGTGDSRWPSGVVNVYDESGMTDTMITAASK